MNTRTSPANGFIGIAVALLAAGILVAQALAQTSYRWMEHTISSLAAQDHPLPWIMQAGFIVFGLLLVTGLSAKSEANGRLLPPDLALILYGLAVVVTGFFCERPLDPELSYSLGEARVHSAFAILAGVFLTTGVLGYLLTEPQPERRSVHLAFLLLISFLSLAFGLAEIGQLSFPQGLLQRVLYAVSLVWLMFATWKT
jgi:hypothetical protein